MRISTRTGFLVAALLVSGYVVVAKLATRPAPLPETPPKPITYASDLPPPAAVPSLTAATTPVPVQQAQAPATSTVLTFASHRVKVTLPVDWGCASSPLTSENLVDVQCAGAGKLRLQVTKTGEDTSIDQFKAHVLDTAPDIIRTTERHTFGGNKVLLWGETNELEGYSTHVVFYRAGLEVTVGRSGSVSNSIYDLRRAVEGVATN